MLTLEKCLAVTAEHYRECLRELTHSLTCSRGLKAALRFHYVVPDGDGEPKFQHLAELLATFIVNYCFSARKFQNAGPQTLTKLYMQARDLFRKYEHSGQAGEVLIYFLLESVLSAPQVLQKMPITTNPGEERKGSDGLHAKWNPDLKLLDVFFSALLLRSSYGLGDRLTVAECQAQIDRIDLRSSSLPALCKAELTRLRRH